MRKKLLLFALVASVMGVKAQIQHAGNIISVANIINAIPGYSAGSLDIMLNDADQDWTSFQFDIKFPDGITFDSYYAGELINKQTLFEPSTDSQTGKVNLKAADQTANPANFKARTGQLVRIFFSVNENTTEGNYNVDITGIRISNLDGTTYKVGEGETDAISATIPVSSINFTLDENAPIALVAPPAGTYTVTVNRKLKANVWNTICLPFAISNIESVFGEGTTVANFSGAEPIWSDPDNEEGLLGIKMSFTKVTSSMAITKPYLIKVASETNQFEIANVSTFNMTAGNFNRSGSRIYGSYICRNVPEENLYISNNQFKYSGGHATIKGLRAYFNLAYTLENYNASRILFNIDGESTTGIFNLEEGTIEKANNYYNLKGQRVANPTKGVYVVDGKKVMFK